MGGWIAGFLFNLALVSVAAAQATDAAAPPPAQQQPVTVGYHVSPPFVMVDSDGAPRGMAIDLWNEIAQGLGYTSTFVAYPTIGGMLAAVETGDIDVAASNLSITEERAAVVDFTQPWFDGGLRVMIDESGTTTPGDIWSGLRDAGYLKSYGLIILLIVVATLGLTLFDRRFDQNFPKRWRDGVAESFYSIMLVVTKGTLPGRSRLFGWVGRIFSAFWLVIGIATFAYVTSSVTSVMTSLAIEGSIRGPDDLGGHTIGVLSGSIGERAMRDEFIDIRRFDNIEAAVQGLRDNDVDAVVADGPVLEYYKQQHPDLGLDVVGRIFRPDKYGFAMPYTDTSRMVPVTVKLLALKEDGVLDKLESTYFGDER
ncbi:transporter substrate-binding domain-containing protein [Breoghania corrubedonensis]|uniref:transporter substrate-binding domain-containing protein n=1 Tax=Breoghania corrubedonensis TaxID=665038 RepID=UPI001AECD71D|nr:transporter substrate-binding domain-containing protein [Breoghania corrubedonensis]